MSIYEYDEEKHMRQEREENWRDGNEAGLIQGREEGRKEGIKVLIKTSKRLNASKEFVKSEIAENFSLSDEKAEEYINKYWNE